MPIDALYQRSQFKPLCQCLQMELAGWKTGAPASNDCLSHTISGRDPLPGSLSVFGEWSNLKEPGLPQRMIHVVNPRSSQNNWIEAYMVTG